MNVSAHMDAERSQFTMITVRERVLKHKILPSHAKCRLFITNLTQKVRILTFSTKADQSGSTEGDWLAALRS